MRPGSRATMRRQSEREEPFSSHLLFSGEANKIHEAIQTHQRTVTENIDRMIPKILQPDKTAIGRMANETGCSLRQLTVEYCVQRDFLDAVKDFYSLNETDSFPPDSPDACITWNRDGGWTTIGSPKDEVPNRNISWLRTGKRIVIPEPSQSTGFIITATRDRPLDLYLESENSEARQNLHSETPVVRKILTVPNDKDEKRIMELARRGLLSSIAIKSP